MSQKNRLIWALVIVFCLPLFFLQPAFGQEVKPQEQVKTAQPEKAQEKIVPSAKNIKESTGICIFVAWMWLSIFVLIYVLRLKIREADRLHKLGYFSRTKRRDLSDFGSF